MTSGKCLIMQKNYKKTIQVLTVLVRNAKAHTKNKDMCICKEHVVLPYPQYVHYITGFLRVITPFPRETTEDKLFCAELVALLLKHAGLMYRLNKLELKHTHI